MIPAYYSREFHHDFGIPSEDIGKKSLMQRVTLVALPYIALYKPAGFLLSLGMDGCRTITNISKCWVGNGEFLETAVSVASFAATIFVYPLGLLLSTVDNIRIEGSLFVKQIEKQQYRELVGTLITIVNNILYLGMFAGGGPGLLTASLALQVLNFLYKARDEYEKQNYLEVAGHLGMAMIRGEQLFRQLKEWKLHLEGMNWDSVLYYLRMPFDMTMERAIQLTMSHAPHKEQQETGLLDRIQFVVTTALLIPTIPLSLLSFGAASVLDTILQQFNAKKFSYLSGRGEEKRGNPSVIATWNVCTLFGGLPIPFGGVAPVANRVDEIAQKILGTNADVVCLQEVSPPAAHLLHQKLQGEYRHFYTRIDPDSLLTLDSGLFIASKTPLENPTVTQLPHLGMMHRAFFTFKVGNLTIGTTHLEPGQTVDASAMRAEQIDKILAAPPNILLGDWNEDPSNLRLPTTYRNTYNIGGPTATDRFTGSPIDYNIDHIFAVHSLQVRTEMEEAYKIGEWATSDHHLLKTTLIPCTYCENN